jgi:hypothetical protein
MIASSRFMSYYLSPTARTRLPMTGVCGCDQSFSRREDDKNQSLVHCHSWGILTVVDGAFRLSPITMVSVPII